MLCCLGHEEELTGQEVRASRSPGFLPTSLAAASQLLPLDLAMLEIPGAQSLEICLLIHHHSLSDSWRPAW